jgi:uncharacterized protein YbaR (Trm112 family)
MAEEIQPVADTPAQPAAEPAATPPVETSSATPPAATPPVAAPLVAPSGSEIEPWLREILRCPNCRSTLSDGSGPSGPELHCTNAECRLAYRIDDGIPVLLVDESRSLAD